jgi:hypothetical protein
MSETGFKKYVRNGMKGRFKHQHIESPTTATGIPDTYFSMIRNVGGWIEFKFQLDWPKRPDTVVKLKNFKKDQKLWLYIHGRMNRNCWFFLKIGKDYLLYDAINAQKVGNLTRSGMYRYAFKRWSNRIDFMELEEILRKGY